MANTNAGNVGSPGNFWQHLADLGGQLRAKDWQGALGSVIDILQHLSSDWGAVMAAPRHSIAAGPPATADNCADQVEQFVQQHRAMFAAGPGGGQAVGAFPWQTLIPILLQVLQAIFARQ